MTASTLIVPVYHAYFILGEEVPWAMRVAHTYIQLTSLTDFASQSNDDIAEVDHEFMWKTAKQDSRVKIQYLDYELPLRNIRRFHEESCHPQQSYCSPPNHPPSYALT